MTSTSKISRESLFKTLEQLLSYSQDEQKRNFSETVELQVVIKNYDLAREKRFAGSIRLPHLIRPRYKVCIMGDEQHCDEARLNKIPCMSVDDLKRFNKDKKKKRNLDHRFHAFLASENVIRQIPRLLGPGLGKAGKFPSLITHDENLCEKLQQVKSTLRIQLKKQPNINVAVGHVNMTIDQLMANVSLSINFIIGLLRKKWQNIGKIFLKSTMGKSYRLY